jgi:uncharacterized protein (TIGR04255 family)
MNRLPKKITPDSLLDTFVQVHYSLRIAKEAMLVEVRNLLLPDFSFIEPTAELENVGMQPDDALLFGHGILFRVGEHLTSFTCSEGYLGWPRYSELIKQVIKRMYEKNWIIEFPRVSVRYINALPWAPLNQQLQVQFPALPNLPAPEHTYYQTSLKTQDGFQISIALTDHPETIETDHPGSTENSESGPFSLFDVGIMHVPLVPVQDLAEVFKQLDKAHQLEKEVFFGLISPEFLLKLNPEYD